MPVKYSGASSQTSIPYYRVVDDYLEFVSDDENSLDESLSNMSLKDLASSSESRSFPYCSLLDAGQAFSGTLTVEAEQRPEGIGSWGINVRILGYDLENGYLCGTMQTRAPMENISAQVTFWEGEIIDNNNFTFITGKWEQGPVYHFRRWFQLIPFAPLVCQKRDGGKSLDLSKYPYIFMRWKERYPVSVGSNCGLELSKDGIYYVCFDCHNGFISGYYFYGNSSVILNGVEYRLLEMNTTNDGRLGFSFASYELQ